MNKIYSMGDMFNEDIVRNELIKALKEKGYKEEKINELMKICDTAYKDHNIPYPTIDKLLKDAK